MLKIIMYCIILFVNVYRSAVEYERKMQSTNFELGEVMEKHLISMAREAEKLRTELANAEKRAMAAIVGAGTAANLGNSYEIVLLFLPLGACWFTCYCIFTRTIKNQNCFVFQVLDMPLTRVFLNQGLAEIHYLIIMLFIRFGLSPVVKI